MHFPRGYKTSKGTTFFGEDVKSTIDHIGRLSVYMGEKSQ